MKLDSITHQLSPIKDFIVRYAVLIFVFSVVGIFAFMTLGIAQYANLEPSESQKEEKLSTLKTVKLDEKSIEKIQSLQDQNINIESLFDNGRDNPFQ